MSRAKAHPHERDERIHAHVHGEIALVVHAAVHHEQILQREPDDARLQLLLLGGAYQLHGRVHRAHELAVLRHVEGERVAHVAVVPSSSMELPV